MIAKYNLLVIRPAGVGLVLQKDSSPGGLEPPTFRLTAERANRLRHGDMLRKKTENKRCV